MAAGRLFLAEKEKSPENRGFFLMAVNVEWVSAWCPP